MICQDFHHPKCAVLVCGSGGRGKSTLFAKILAAQRADFTFIYDHKGEFCSRFGYAQNICDSIETLTQRTAEHRACFLPWKMYPGQKEEGFLFFADFVFTFCGEVRGRKLLVCDEVQQMAYQQNPQELKDLFDDGRRRGIDLFFISQSANQLHNMVLNQFTEIYVFQQQTRSAFAPLEEIGFDKDEIKTLKPGEYVWRNTTNGEQRKGGSAFRIKSTAKRNF